MGKMPKLTAKVKVTIVDDIDESALVLIITGNPPIKKNSRDIVRNNKTGRMYPIKSDKLIASEESAIYELLDQKTRFDAIRLPINTPVRVKFLFYRKTQHVVDLSNLYEFAQDCLQRAEIIANDSLIESHDGSRKYYDPENPRTEIYITPFKE